MPSPNSKARSSTTSLARANSTGIALRRGEIKISEPIPIPREGEYDSMRADGTWPRESMGPSLSDHVNANAIATDPPEQRFSSHNMTSRVPQANQHESLSSELSKSSLSKKTGLRATIKKLFGGRKKRDTISSVLEKSAASDRQHPTSFITTAESARPITRTSSMPLKAVSRNSALGSHSPFAVLFPSEGHQFSGEENARDSYLGSHRRRNTLPSVVLSAKEAQTLAATLGDLGMSPTSRSTTVEEPMSIRSKRRSRSAGALREAALAHRMSPIQWRRRSDEIKYWRNSVLEAPLPEHISSRPQTGDYGQDALIDGEANRDLTAPEKVIYAVPSQQFDFGNLMGSGNEGSSSLENRVTVLEVRSMDLEYAIAKLQGHAPVVIGKPPPGRKSPRFSQRESGQSLTTSRSADSPGPTFLSSPQPSPDPSPDPQDNPPLKHRIHRSSAATTLRPATAVRRSGDQSQSATPSNPLETFEHLLYLLQREQSARHQLEIKFSALQRQMDQLQRSPPYAHFKTNLYPTPSPEEAQPMNSMRQFSAGRGSFGSGSNPMRVGATGPNSRFRDDISVDTDTDDGFADVYETPIDDGDHKYGIENMSPQYHQSPQMAGMI